MASEYKIAIHIAGELEKSFGSSIQGAQQGIASLAGGKMINGIKTLGKVAMTSMMAAGAAIGAAGIYSVNTGREFEAAMSSTAATAGASAEEYTKLRDAAMEMGRTTSKTATESANALEYMALAGWSVDDSIASLPSVLRLSEATGLDLATTSDLVTDSMSATGTSIEDLSTYLDICARAQNSSNQTAEQMMEAYIGVGGVLNNLGVPLTESSAALGVMANRGIKGSEAGTALNAIMTNLTTGTGQAGKAMEAIGVSAFDSEGNFIGLEETLRAVNDATQNMTEEERNATLAAIGGKHHVKDLNALLAGLNETNEEGVSEWNALEGELENSNGALETMAATKLDNLNGDLDILTSSIQDLGIRAYETMNGPLRGAVQWATDEVYKLSDALTDGGLEGFSSALGTVLADGVVKISEYAPQFIDAATTLISSFLTGITDNADKIGNGAAQTAGALIRGFLKIIPQMSTTALTLVGSFLTGMKDQMPSIIEQGKQSATNLIAGIQQNLPQILSTGIDLILQLWNGMATIMPILITGGMQIIGQLLSGIGQRMPEIITAGVQLTGQILLGLVQGLPYIVQGGLTLIIGLVEGIVQNLPTIVNTAIIIIEYLVQGFVNNLPQILTIGMILLLQLAQGIAQNLPVIVQAAIDIIGQLAAGIIQNLPIILVYGAQIIAALASGILNGFAVLLASIPGLFGQIGEAILSIDWLEVGGQILEGIKSGIIAAWGTLVETITGLWSDFKTWFAGDNAEYTENTIDGYTETMDGRYTNGIDGNYYTAQELADQGVAGAAEVAARQAEPKKEVAGPPAPTTEQTTATNVAAQAAEASTWQPDFSKIYSSGEEAGTAYGEGLTSSILAGAQEQADAMSQGATQGAAQTSTDMITQLQSQLAGSNMQTVGTEAGNEVGTNLQESINQALASLGADTSTWQPDLSSMYSSGGEAGTAYGEGMTNSIQTGAQGQADAMSQSAAQGATQASNNLISQLQTQLTGGSMQSVGTDAGNEVGANLQASINQALASLGTGQGATIDTETLMAGLTSGMSTQGTQAGQDLLNSFNAGTASMPADMSATGTEAMTGLTGAVETGGATAASTAQTSANQVVAAFSGLSGSLYTSGANAIRGFTNGMNSMAGVVQATAQRIAQAAANTINAALKIGSPSKLLEQTGQFTGQGFALGLAGTESMIRSAASDAIGGVTGTTAENRSGVIGSTMQNLSKRTTQAESGSGGTMTVTYAPTYQINGSGLTKNDVVQAGRTTQAEFEKMMKQYIKNQGRLSFA